MSFPGKGTIVKLISSFLLTLAVIIAVKSFVADIYKINETSMDPGLIPGDRVLITKLISSPLLRRFFKPEIGDAVVFSHPEEPDLPGCLRVAGIPGDTVYVSKGVFCNTVRPELSEMIGKEHPDLRELGSFPPTRLSSKGESVQLEDLPFIKRVIYYSMIRQETNKKRLSIDMRVYRKGKVIDDYFLEDFLLYSGELSEVPDSLAYKWSFWAKLKEHILVSTDEKDMQIRPVLRYKGEILHEYKFRNGFYYLLSDNLSRKTDSRIFGPVASKNLKGRAGLILWSKIPEKSIFRSLRFDRFFKGIDVKWKRE
ncbi:MAG: signal peptidase I [Chitinivibrionales bacterium]